MKKLLLILMVALAIACQKDESSSSENSTFSGENYITINGDTIDISLTESDLYYSVSLTSDAYNLLDVNIDPDYTLSIDGVEYENGEDYKFGIDELSLEIDLAITIENNQSGESITSYLATLPEAQLIGEVTANNPPEDGFYYVAYNSSIFKMSTSGEVVYYRTVTDSNLFNRTEVDGVVYYSYLDYVEYDIDDYVEDTGSLRSKAVVMDENYQVLDVVETTIAHDGIDALALDNHQFQLLDLGHYLISAYHQKIAYNIPGHEDGVKIIEPVIQEIKDGELLFHWASSDYPEFYDYYDYVPFDSERDIPYDYVHFNRATIDPTDNNIVLSLRATSSIVKLDRESGDIIWILGGNGDQFGLEGDQFPLGQHDVCALGDGVYTIFNNNYFLDGLIEEPTAPFETKSGAIKYYLDEDNLTLLDYERYEGNATSVAEGSAQELGIGHYVMCWGMNFDSEYIFSEQNFITGELYFGLGKISSMDTYKVLKYDK